MRKKHSTYIYFGSFLTIHVFSLRVKSYLDHFVRLYEIRGPKNPKKFMINKFFYVIILSLRTSVQLSKSRHCLSGELFSALLSLTYSLFNINILIIRVAGILNKVYNISKCFLLKNDRKFFA